VSGYNYKMGAIGKDFAIVFSHTGSLASKSFETSNMTPFAGAASVTSANREQIRQTLSRHYGIGPRDAVVLLQLEQTAPGKGQLNLSQSELDQMLLRHEQIAGLAPMKNFLSHKGADKSLVRDFDKTLKLIGFEPWLDEDAIIAGDTLERALLKGFDDSCAVVFFVTENFLDENYLETEINYALNQKREKKEKFAIITLCFNRGSKIGTVPKILKTYAYKEPTTDLEALREIIRALPIQVGDVRWRT
jgi:hypothetical protein